MAQDLVMCESVFPDRSHTQVQARSAVVWGMILPVHIRERFLHVADVYW